MTKWKKRLQGLFATSLALSCVGLWGIQFFLTPHANVWAEETEISAESEAVSPRVGLLVEKPSLTEESHYFFTVNNWVLDTDENYPVTTCFVKNNGQRVTVVNKTRYKQVAWSEETAVNYAYSTAVKDGVTYTSGSTYNTLSINHVYKGSFDALTSTIGMEENSIDYVTTKTIMYFSFSYHGTGFVDKVVTLPTTQSTGIVEYFSFYKGELALEIKNEGSVQGGTKYSFTIIRSAVDESPNFDYGSQMDVAPTCLLFGE